MIEEEIKALRDFALFVMQTAATRLSVDSTEIQNKCLELGLLKDEGHRDDLLIAYYTVAPYMRAPE